MNSFRTYALSFKTDELKELIKENPDLPIVVLAGEEANNGDYGWMFCSSVSFQIEEILDCDYCDDNDCVFVDRSDLESHVENALYDEYCDKTEEEYEAAIKARLEELEPFWTKVIAIYATN